MNVVSEGTVVTAFWKPIQVFYAYGGERLLSLSGLFSWS